MIRLASVIATFEADFLAHYRDRLRPEHYQALAAMKHCRCSPHLFNHVSVGTNEYS
jgi:hypothetical protein